MMWSPREPEEFSWQSFTPWHNMATGKLVDEWRRKRRFYPCISRMPVGSGRKLKSSKIGGKKAFVAMELKKLRLLINESSKPALWWD